MQLVDFNENLMKKNKTLVFPVSFKNAANIKKKSHKGKRRNTFFLIQIVDKGIPLSK